MPNIFDRVTQSESISGVHPTITTPLKKPNAFVSRQAGQWQDLAWDDFVSEELNTYRNLNPVALNHEPVLDLEKGEGPNKESQVFGGEKGAMEGRFSLFNHNNAVLNNTESQIQLNAPLYDSPSIRKTIRENSDCSVRALVNASENGLMGRALYRYSDFMFCKHLGKISNNYLITLRRFPIPAGDHINYTLPPSQNIMDGNDNEFNGHQPDIGRLVTWMGTPGNDMSSILKYDVNLPYKEMQAQIQSSQVNADSGAGPLAQILNMSNPSYMRASRRGAAGASSIDFVGKALGPKLGSHLKAPSDTSWAYHRDQTKAYGPVDAIAKTHYRAGAEDGGIKFEHNITLTFDYELRAFDGINTRAAMLDLLSNILAVTFSNATYWGGAIHGNGQAQSNVFANLPIFHMQYPASISTMKSAVMESAGQLMKSFNNNNDVKSLGDFVNTLMNFGKSFLNIAADGLLNSLGRPQKEGLDSLINFSPTGVWHLMIGNPKHPIMSMGNMILDNCTIEHYGPLGLDDFPTGLKVTITLKHGMPRDTMKIEQMYMNGDFRIYQPLGNQGLKAWRNAQELYKPDQNSDQAYNADTLEDLSAPDNPDNPTPSIEGQLNEINSYKSVYIKYYGTTDPIDILKTNMEAHLGSEPVKNAYEEAADELMKQKAQEKEAQEKGRRRR